MAQRQKRIRRTLEEWRSSWERRDINAFMSVYSPGFRDGAFDADGWRQKKSATFAQARWIKIELKDLRIDVDRGRAVARFEQRYNSSGYSDIGGKVLLLSDHGGQWRIIRETWRETGAPEPRVVSVSLEGVGVFNVSNHSDERLRNVVFYLDSRYRFEVPAIEPSGMVTLRLADLEDVDDNSLKLDVSITPTRMTVWATQASGDLLCQAVELGELRVERSGY